LHIDDEDALDPPYLARRFAQRLRQALDAGASRLGRSVIVRVGTPAATWPLSPDEASDSVSRRLWHVDGSADLPAGINFLAEVMSERDLGTAPRGVYRALLAAGRLRVGRRGRVLRWAHAREVEIGVACRIDGRVSAERSITVGPSARFGLLHAPEIRFAAPADMSAGPLSTGTAGVMHTGLPNAARWEIQGSHAVSGESARIEAHHAWRGDLVCRGELELGGGCHASGSLKSHGDLIVGAGCHVTGSLFAGGAIHLGTGCVVQGCVVSETAVRLDPGCVVGTPAQPATVAAPRIDAAPSVRVHGTVWADVRGRARRDASVAASLRTAARLGEASSAPRSVA
jgi:cytoskeletal protein CcmA (bactofilin family)